MQIDTTLMLLKYKRWIDMRMLSAIATTDPHRYRAERKKMLRLMQHIHVADIVVRANLTGEEHDFREMRLSRQPEAATLMLSMLACSNWFVEYATSLPVDAWQGMVMYRRMDGRPEKETTAALFEQVILHGTRHRSAVGWLIGTCGGSAPQDVASAFLRERLRAIR